MQITIYIPEKDIPKRSGIMEINLSFCDGELCQCDYPFDVNIEKTGHCKDCKYFEYDSVAKVDGIPLIVAHEICSKWGDGCKTSEDGYCFLFEPKEKEDDQRREDTSDTRY